MMSKEKFNAIVSEAERLWRLRYPNRSDKTYTAQLQIGRLLTEARRNVEAVTK